MNIGKRVVQLWSHANGNYYQIHLPAPQTLEHAKRHIENVQPPHVRENMLIVELDVVSSLPANEAIRRDTIPCAAPMAETEAAE